MHKEKNPINFSIFEFFFFFPLTASTKENSCVLLSCDYFDENLDNQIYRLPFVVTEFSTQLIFLRETNGNIDNEINFVNF